MFDVPEALFTRIDQVGRRILGRHDATGNALAHQVAGLSEAYNREREQLDDKPRAPGFSAARLRFFLPRDLLKVLGPLAELHGRGLLESDGPLRVLDVGAGMGATTLGTALFTSTHDVGIGALTVDAWDPYELGLRVMAGLLEGAEQIGLPKVTLRTHCDDIRKARLSGTYDLILFGLSLNEMFADLPDDEAVEARAQLLERLAGHLSASGSLIVLEPALKSTARSLQTLRARLLAQDALTSFAPCLHQMSCPMLENDRDWCHEDIPVPLPRPLAEVARAAGLRFERLTYAYLTLRKDGQAVGRPAYATEDQLHLRVVSRTMASKGKTEAMGCTDEGQLVRLMRLNRHRTPMNKAFGDARRGQLLSFSDSAAGQPTRPIPDKGRLRISEHISAHVPTADSGPER